MMIPLILAVFLLGCSPLPTQSSKQEQTQRQDSKQDVNAEQQATQQSEHRQGTNSMPIIVICNQNNSAYSVCATPGRQGVVESLQKGMK